MTIPFLYLDEWNEPYWGVIYKRIGWKAYEQKVVNMESK